MTRILPLIPCLISLNALAAPVESIQLEGLWRTEPFVVERELPWKIGEEVSAEAWELGLTRLWNMGLFSRVDASMEEGVAKFELEERFTINPLFRFSTAGSAGWVRAGLSDTNLFGRFIEVGAQYERFGPHNGGQAWVKDPRLFHRRMTGLVQVERLARPRPGFVVFRSLARLEGSGFLDDEDRIQLMGRVDLFSDRFDSEGSAPPAGEGALVSAGVKLGRVDIVRLRQRGESLELRPSVGVMNEGSSVFGQMFLEALAFRMPGERWTLAARVQAGLSTSTREQNRFYIGGLDLVRGLPDNHVRTLGYGVVNLEARLVAWDSTWLAIVPAAFVDGLLAHKESGGVQALASAGLGVRLLIPKLVSTGLRADLATPLDGSWSLQPSFGVFQFF